MSPILLLHGALGAADQFDGLKQLLSSAYEVHTLDFSGHGSASIPEAPYSIALFAADVLQYMDAHGLERVPVFGYSMGGYVGLYLARFYPERISAILTLATKLHWDETIAAKEVAMLDADKIMAKVPQLATVLEERHRGHGWKNVVQRTADMLLQMGLDAPLKTIDFTAIQQPVTLLLGDRDKMVSLEETLAAYKSLPKGKMGMLPGTPHPYEQVNSTLLAAHIHEWMP